MNLPKFPHSAMFVGVTACRKIEFLLNPILDRVWAHPILDGGQKSPHVNYAI